ncbi:MAG TPA: methylenetetrahydrofolate reductase, partial [Methanosarcinales archaeon]|nr:methylenetetrahydrofolate reductase [Methanosarcinales archaeon]
MFENFCKQLHSKKPFITVEITPPHGASIKPTIE